MSDAIEARNHCSAVVVTRALIARSGRVTMVGHEKDCDYDPDDVAAVVAEAIRQREEIERKKWTREFIVDGWRFVVMREDDGSFHVGSPEDGRSWAASFAMRVLAAYRELVAANGGDHGPQ